MKVSVTFLLLAQLAYLVQATPLPTEGSSRLSKDPSATSTADSLHGNSLSPLSAPTDGISSSPKVEKTVDDSVKPEGKVSSVSGGNVAQKVNQPHNKDEDLPATGGTHIQAPVQGVRQDMQGEAPWEPYTPQLNTDIGKTPSGTSTLDESHSATKSVKKEGESPLETHDSATTTSNKSPEALKDTLAQMEELNIGHSVSPEANHLGEKIRASKANNKDESIAFKDVIEETADGTKNTHGRNMATPEQASSDTSYPSARPINIQSSLGALNVDELNLLKSKEILTEKDQHVSFNFRRVEELGILQPGVIRDNGGLPEENWDQIPLKGSDHKLSYLVQNSKGGYVYNLRHLVEVIREVEGANSVESNTMGHTSAVEVQSSTTGDKVVEDKANAVKEKDGVTGVENSDKVDAVKEKNEVTGVQNSDKVGSTKKETVEPVKQDVSSSKSMQVVQNPSHPGTEAKPNHSAANVLEPHDHIGTKADSSPSVMNISPFSDDKQATVIFEELGKVLLALRVYG
ncbi:hypothetical protein IWQ62_003852 [Dispira parvispora]|uniref:Uncharacterized protein n=1 Tax=Dispira parvispora TaxID=1520584 RepID=A0A9W8AR01_9FUNG|nr:hypothetical protein IWQ62_003852 [Dispira parvispora]